MTAHRLPRSPAVVLAALLVAVPVHSAWAASKDSAPQPAVLRVMSDPSDAQVSLDGAPIGKTPLEYSVVREGKAVLHLTCEGCRDLWQTVSLAAGEGTSLNLRLEPLRAAVLVESDPSGASVSLDGAHVDETPVLLPHVAIGTHRLTVSQPGFQSKTVELDVPNDVPQRVHVDLVTDSATLRVSSVPEGARVSLDGVPRGTAPVVLDRIPDGTVVLEVEADGYRPFRREMRLSAGYDEPLDVVLEPLPGTLRIVTIPDGARVYLDNAFRGNAPLTLEELPPGSYRVRVELAAHDPAARTIELGRAASVVEEFRLVPNCGTLLVNTTPAGVRVLVDGKERGTTLAKSMSTDPVSETLEIPLVEAGERVIVLTREGYHDATVRVTVERDKSQPVSAELRRRFIPDFEVRTAEKTYRGVFIESTDEFLRLETEPGVTRSFEQRKILGRRLLREDERTEVR